MDPEQHMTLRVAGVGHSLTLELDQSATVGDLKLMIEQKTRLPCAYQRLVTRGKSLDDPDATLIDKGIENRTKLMLLHSALFAQDKSVFEQLDKIENEIFELEAKAEKESVDPIGIKELVTQICCRLDEVDVKGSDNLRQKRKNALKRAEALDVLHQGKK